MLRAQARGIPTPLRRISIVSRRMQHVGGRPGKSEQWDENSVYPAIAKRNQITDRPGLELGCTSCYWRVARARQMLIPSMKFSVRHDPVPESG